MRIRIDIGGTKLEAAAFDRGGELRLRCRIPTPCGDYAATVDAIAHLVEPIESELCQRCTLGFGIPGNISAASGLTKNAYSSPFNHHPHDRNMAARFDLPIRLMNDTNCFALIETRGGAAAGAKIVFDAILSTDCRSGIVVGMSHVTRLYQIIPAQWSYRLFSDRVITKLRLPWFGDSSAVCGAAWLWPEGVAL
tara:strand:- start:85 stop:666 length:582 start_codon:yes stop_codon:yes gene_type:complete